MYIKNGKNKINCTDFVSNNSNSVLFYLSTEPKLTKINTTIELYDDSDFLMTSVNRNDYKNEKISKFGETYILTLTNEDEVVISLDDVKASKIKELSEQANTIITNGFYLDINGESKHFSLEVHDQQNITIICQYLDEHEDVTEYLYHADNEELTLYSKENLKTIRDMALETIMSNIEQYHVLKKQVNNAVTIDEVNQIML